MSEANGERSTRRSENERAFSRARYDAVLLDLDGVITDTASVAQQRQRRTTIRITRSPIIKLLVDRHTRRIRPTAQTRIERCSSIIAVSAEP